MFSRYESAALQVESGAAVHAGPVFWFEGLAVIPGYGYLRQHCARNCFFVSLNGRERGRLSVRACMFASVRVCPSFSVCA